MTFDKLLEKLDKKTNWIKVRTTYPDSGQSIAYWKKISGNRVQISKDKGKTSRIECLDDKIGDQTKREYANQNQYKVVKG